MVKVSANLFDSSGQLIDTNYDYIWDNLPAGERQCFDIRLSNHAGWAYYEFENPTYWTSGHAFPNVALLNVSATYNSARNSYTVLGQVRNNHDKPVSGVAVFVTLYDAAGFVMGCGMTWPNDSSLEPGQVSAFKLEWYGTGNNYANVASYRIQVDGNPQ